MEQTREADPVFARGRPTPPGKKQVRAHGGTARVRDPASEEDFRDNVGKLPWAAGTEYNLPRTLRARLNAEAGESPTGVAHEPVGAMTEG